MIKDLGTVRPGSTIYVPWHTFSSDDPSASMTITGLAVTDIEIYKDGSATQRASDAGFTLLDTDGIDFDTHVGIHGVSIDLSDNTTANFYEAGSQYWVVVASITIDAATINFIPVTFRIGYEAAVLDTTIATLASQVGFTLEDGSADNDAYNGYRALVHDLASAVQVAAGVVSDYVGATKTITLKADPGIFTMAAGDNISLFMPALTATTPGATLDVNATGEAGVDLDNTSGTIAAAQLAADCITSAKIADDAISSEHLNTGALTADAFAADALVAATFATSSLNGKGDWNTVVPASLAEFNARSLPSADYVIVSDTIAGVTLTTTTTNLTNAPSDSSGVTTLLSRLSAARAGYLDNLSAGAVALASKVKAYFQLLVRSDAAINTDNTTELGELNNNEGSGAGDYDNQTDAVEAVRDHVGDGTNLTEAGGDGDHLTESGGTGDQLTAITVSELGAQAKLDVNVEADTALSDYDPPTNAEMEARTPTAAQLAYIVANAATGMPVTFTTAGGSTTVAVINEVDGAAGSPTNDQYNGRLLVFTDDTLKGVVTDITDYVGATTTATITAIPFAPTSSHNARLI